MPPAIAGVFELEEEVAFTGDSEAGASEAAAAPPRVEEVDVSGGFDVVEAADGEEENVEAPLSGLFVEIVEDVLSVLSVLSEAVVLGPGADCGCIGVVESWPGPPPWSGGPIRNVLLEAMGVLPSKEAMRV